MEHVNKNVKIGMLVDPCVRTFFSDKELKRRYDFPTILNCCLPDDKEEMTKIAIYATQYGIQDRHEPLFGGLRMIVHEKQAQILFPNVDLNNLNLSRCVDKIISIFEFLRIPNNMLGLMYYLHRNNDIAKLIILQHHIRPLASSIKKCLNEIPMYKLDNDYKFSMKEYQMIYHSIGFMYNYHNMPNLSKIITEIPDFLPEKHVIMNSKTQRRFIKDPQMITKCLKKELQDKSIIIKEDVEHDITKPFIEHSDEVKLSVAVKDNTVVISFDEGERQYKSFSQSDKNDLDELLFNSMPIQQIGDMKKTFTESKPDFQDNLNFNNSLGMRSMVWQDML